MRNCVPALCFALAASLLGSIGRAQAQPKADSIPLQKEHFIGPGLDYRSLLFIKGAKLSVLTGNGLTVNKTFDLDKHYKQIAERDAYYVALALDKSVDLLDKKSLKVTKHIDLKAPGITVINLWDLAIHPTKPICYVTVCCEISAPAFRVLVIDETSGTVTAPPEMYGTYLAVAPTGDLLCVGFKDICPKNFTLPILGGKFTIRGHGGGIDTLFTYTLQGDKATSRVKQIFDQAGANCQGLRLSPDGKRLTYLSIRGYPDGSGNLVALDARDITKGKSVSYALKDVGSTSNMAYHPTLKLVAMPGLKSPAVFFDRETGEVQADRFKAQPNLGDMKVDQVYFSPDGKHLVMACSDKVGPHSLRAVELKLSAAEAAAVEKGYIRPTAPK